MSAALLPYRRWSHAFLQGMVGIVISQRGKNIAALGFQRGLGGAVHKAASGIGGAVGAIRANGEHRAAIQPGDTGSGGKGELLIAAAFTVAGQMHHCFATCNQGNTAARGGGGGPPGGPAHPRVPGVGPDGGGA